MNSTLPGIHHVTAITADAQQNVDFYCGVLGLRLVKLTVNFDDPGSYHLYYGDDLGRPGTIMTFFAWPGGYPGRIGPPQATATSFAVPAESLSYWAGRLRQFEVETAPISERFGEPVLSFADPNGMKLEIIATAAANTPTGGLACRAVLPAEHSILGFHGVTLSEEGYENTARLLTDVLGFRADGNEDNRFRYRASDEFASVVDLLCTPDARKGSMGAGVVHHVAFRTRDDEQQAAWRKAVVGLGLNASPVMDRKYFHSIYFREPGGVLFEIATDGPGFTADEPAESLGTTLKLPAQFEPYRSQLEKVLPRIQMPPRGPIS
jgi:catechol 2,3-dioxygenase-like lactoylglutathione lyase family enzyme